MPPLRSRPEWPGWSEIPVGFTVVENPGDYDARRGALELRAGNTSFFESRRTRGQGLYTERVKALWDWAQQHNYVIFGYGWTRPSMTINDRAIRLSRVVKVFYITKLEFAAEIHVGMYDALRFTSDNISFTCAHCRQQHTYGTFVCPNTNEFTVCPNCQEAGVRAEIFSSGGETEYDYVCNNCGHQCAATACERLTHTRYCNDHASHASCAGCRVIIEWRPTEPAPLEMGGLRYCVGCAGRVCPGCSQVVIDSPLGWSSHHNAHVCTSCRTQVFRQSAEEYETEESTVTTLATLPGRENIRACGIEIEGANGTQHGGNLARRLYDAGYASTYSLTEHQSGERYGKVHVERDSSVDWEMVIGPLNMALTGDANLLNNVVKVIRSMVRDKELALDLRCGLHVHVSAARVGLHQAYNLSHIFTYLEDPLFRIAAAKWPYHRASQGSHYCAPIPKFSRKLEFFNNRGGVVTRDNHYFALSFSNYFNAKLRNCQCGAVAGGMWDECTCPNLGKCTFEFRLFNTTANPKKVMAYVALSQALVAKAISMPEITRPHDEYPGLEFNQQVFSEMGTEEKQALVENWKPRLAFILNELPLTTQERDAVLYCIRNSEIDQGLSQAEIQELMTREVTV